MSLKTEMRESLRNFSADRSSLNVQRRRNQKKFRTKREKKMPDEEYRDFIYSVFALCYSVLAGVNQDNDED